MLLTAPAAHDRAAELAKHLTRDICDAGLQLGFSLRTLSEACSLALKDATIFTSLAESRFLCGNQRLFERFMERFRHAAAANGDRWSRTSSTPGTKSATSTVKPPTCWSRTSSARGVACVTCRLCAGSASRVTARPIWRTWINAAP